ncbi:MAG: amidohydrolase family protein [Gemmatimonadota bacterium]
MMPVVLALALGIARAAPVQAPLVIEHVTVIDGTGTAPRARMAVVVRGRTIEAIVPMAGFKAPPHARIVDGAGGFVIPGLWDMHVHVAAFGRSRLPLFLAGGVTAVRDLGGPPDSVFGWQREVRAGTLAGPRIFAVGRLLSAGDMGDAFGVALIKTPDDARAAVLANKARGAVAIKVWSLLPKPAYLAAADEARRQKLMLIGHVPDEISWQDAVKAGHRGFEHLLGLPVSESSNEPELLERLVRMVDAAPDVGAKLATMVSLDMAAIESFDSTRALALFRDMKAAGAWVCPTLTDSHAYTVMKDSLPTDLRLAYLPKGLRDGWIADAAAMPADLVGAWRALFPVAIKNVGRLHRAGVRIIAGTDAGATYDMPGFDIHNELALLVRAGLSPMEAIQAATQNAALATGQGARMGTIRAGKVADLLLLSANPLTHIGNTRRIAGVIAAGTYYSAAALSAELERVRGMRD